MDEEKSIITCLQGELTPAAVFMGNNFYAERYVNPQEFTSLESLADKGQFHKSLEHGANIYAELANKRIRHDHNRWLDEFHVSGTKYQITDTGRIHFFRTKGQDREFDTYLAQLQTSTLDQFIAYSDIFLHPFNDEDPRFFGTVAAIGSLSQDKETQLNLMLTLRSALKGMQSYFVSRIETPSEAWDQAMLYFPGFVAHFVNRYEQLREQKK